MEFIKLNPFIRYASAHAKVRQSKKLSVCYDCRLFYVTSGKGGIVANGKNYLLSENDVVFLPPETKYGFTTTGEFTLYVINLDLVDEFTNFKKSFGTPDEDGFDSKLTLKYPLPKDFSEVIVVKNAYSVKRHLERCVELFLQKTPYYVEESTARVKLALLETLRESQNSEYPIVQKVIDYIRENYWQLDLTNQTIAKNFNYHENNISSY